MAFFTEAVIPSSALTDCYRESIRTIEGHPSQRICCGLYLADVHELIVHYEIVHHIVLGLDGTPAPSDSSDLDEAIYLYAAADSAYAWRDVNPPALPSFHSGVSSLSEPLEFGMPRLSEEGVSPPPSYLCQPEIPPHPSLAASDANPSSVPNSSDSSLANALTGPLVPSLAKSTQSIDRVEVASASEVYTIENHEMACEDGNVPTKRWVSPRRRSQIQPMLKQRVKKFVCPQPGCIKKYLNPNGLKYHIEKGTCKIEPIKGGHETIT